MAKNSRETHFLHRRNGRTDRFERCRKLDQLALKFRRKAQALPTVRCCFQDRNRRPWSVEVRLNATLRAVGLQRAPDHSIVGQVPSAPIRAKGRIDRTENDRFLVQHEQETRVHFRARFDKIVLCNRNNEGIRSTGTR